MCRNGGAGKTKFAGKGRVADPHRFNEDPDTDPDPPFFLVADPDPVLDPGF